MLEDMNTKQTEQTEKSANDKAAWHRRRIKRMKIAIVTIAIILLILPTLLCIILGLKVGRLQNQVEELVSIHKEEIGGLAKETDKAGSYVYAAERSTASGQPSPETQSLEEIEQTTGDKEQASNSTGVEGQLLSDMTLIPTPVGELTMPGTPITGTSESGVDVSGNAEANTTADDAVSPDKAATEPIVEADPVEDEEEKANAGIYGGKKVYLTFDDGPSMYTDEILDILKDYGVKATFFVIGKKDSESKRLYNRIIEEGHTLGMHSYSHVYKQIYNSAEDFDKDFTKLWKLLYDTTGYMPTIYRFPGGSANKVNKHGMDEFIRYLKEKSIVYYDWNVDNGDATGNEFTKEELSNNILNGVAAKKRSIVLLHDAQGKRATVDSLPMVLEALILGGAEVLPLTEDVAPIQQIKAKDVK